MTISERMFNLLESKSLKSVDLTAILGVGTGQISTWKKEILTLLQNIYLKFVSF